MRRRAVTWWGHFTTLFIIVGFVVLPFHALATTANVKARLRGIDLVAHTLMGEQILATAGSAVTPSNLALFHYDATGLWAYVDEHGVLHPLEGDGLVPFGGLAAGVVTTASRALAAEGAAARITSGSQVTEQVIRAAMKDAPLASQQARGISLPRVQEYVDKLLAGEAAPAIKVDGRMIVDGNYRYIAGKVLGQEPPIQPWAGGRPERLVPWDTIPINPEPW